MNFIVAIVPDGYWHFLHKSSVHIYTHHVDNEVRMGSPDEKEQGTAPGNGDGGMCIKDHRVPSPLGCESVPTLYPLLLGTN